MGDLEIETKQIEPALKEHEAATEEKEPWWKNPIVISLVGATLALAGNIATNILNNRASAEAEHFRAQSNLVLSVIKTNGNEEDACKNLNFFVNIGWLDDAKGAIHNACGKKGENGVPTLPTTTSTSSQPEQQTVSVSGGSVFPWVGSVSTLTVRVEDADSHQPIANAKVDLESPPLSLPFLQQQTPVLAQPQGSTVVSTTFTGTTGDATLNFVSSSENLTVSKDGYASVTKPMSQSGLFASSTSALMFIDLHRVPTSSKH